MLAKANAANISEVLWDSLTPVNSYSCCEITFLYVKVMLFLRGVPPVLDIKS